MIPMYVWSRLTKLTWRLGWVWQGVVINSPCLGISAYRVFFGDMMLFPTKHVRIVELLISGLFTIESIWSLTTVLTNSYKLDPDALNSAQIDDFVRWLELDEAQVG